VKIWCSGEIFFRRNALEESGERVGGVFQGGEVVYAKVFDEEGREMRNEGSGGWVIKKRGDSKKPYGGVQVRPMRRDVNGIFLTDHMDGTILCSFFDLKES